MMQGSADYPTRYIYQVHPSYTSSSSLRITRAPLVTAPAAVRASQENPYVYKPKSYSRKRTAPEGDIRVSTGPAVRKAKLPIRQEFKEEQGNSLDAAFVEASLADKTTPFFAFNHKNARIEIEDNFRLPFGGQFLQKAKKNPQLSSKIEIVSTNNEKIQISIHEGLLKANTNHSKQEQSLEGIVNPFNSSLKDHYSMMIPFIRDYRSGYTPIQLQNRSKRQEEHEGGYQDQKKGVNSSAKSHFIKKKQSTLSLPRTCGVSYIRPSQSHQAFPFQPLPPLIFQCSTSCNYTPELRQLYHSSIDELVRLAQSRWLPVVWTREENMRDLLLGKPKGKVLWVEGLSQLWPLFNEGNFLLVFFHEKYAETEQEVWQQFYTCPFKFGILAKKSTSGKKLFLKSIQPQAVEREQTLSIETEPKMLDERIPEQKKAEDSPFEERKQCKDVCQEFMKELKNSRTVITMSLKFQMYVHEDQWKRLNWQSKNLLNAIIHSFEEHLQKKAIEVIRDRLELSSPTLRQELIPKALSHLRMGRSIEHLGQAKKQEIAQSLTLQYIQNLITALNNRSQTVSAPLIPFNQLMRDKEGKENANLWYKHIKMPIYYISTRDSFAFDLVQKITYLPRGERTYKKIEYFFQADNIPQNFGDYRKLFPDLRVGVTSYHDFYTEEELNAFEKATLETERSAFKNQFLQMTVQPTIVGSRIKRTKFFFGYRYMWTRCQLAQPTSYVGAGVRRDVTPAPKWIRNVQQPLVDHQILEKGFINSVAINVYHDGTEGLAQHFDDAVRFKQPIYTIRLVSDGRLSFGSQFYGFCNGAFIIPLPRGCICKMEENSYAANGVKHCVRPCDMSGKSAAVIMRQMHEQVVSQATKYDELIDFPAWLSSMSEDERAITFAEQKRREAERILAFQEGKKERQREREKEKQKQKDVEKEKQRQLEREKTILCLAV